jgi:hypothetical protein
LSAIKSYSQLPNIRQKKGMLPNRLVCEGAALPGGAVALVHAGNSFFGAAGEELAASGLAVEQLAQEAGDFAFASARIDNSASCAS